MNDLLRQQLLLHRRLLAGDRTASAEVIELLLKPLVAVLRQKFPRADEHTLWDGATDAILDLCARPETFDAARGVPLDRFLQIAAWRNVANILRGERRRRARETLAVSELNKIPVALSVTAGNILQSGADSGEGDHRRLKLLRVLKDPLDRRVMKLRLRGERRTAVFAELLGLSHLPLADQRREVKKVKDRIDKIIRRHRGSGHE